MRAERVFRFYKDSIFKNWIYNNPRAENKKYTKEFNQWLKEHKEDYCEMYHGTSAKIPILKEGLKKTSSKRRRTYQSGSGYVYLSIYPSMAETFGQMGYPMESIAVYAVRIKIKDLLPDKDQLNNKRFYGEIKDLKNTLAESIIVGSGARVKRNIFPYELKKIN